MKLCNLNRKGAADPAHLKFSSTSERINENNCQCQFELDSWYTIEWVNSGTASSDSNRTDLKVGRVGESD